MSAPPTPDARHPWWLEEPVNGRIRPFVVGGVFYDASDPEVAAVIAMRLLRKPIQNLHPVEQVIANAFRRGKDRGFDFGVVAAFDRVVGATFWRRVRVACRLVAGRHPVLDEPETEE